MNQDTGASKVPYYSIPPIKKCGDSRNRLGNLNNGELPPVECGYFRDNRMNNSKALARGSGYEEERQSDYYNQPTEGKLS